MNKLSITTAIAAIALGFAAPALAGGKSITFNGFASYGAVIGEITKGPANTTAAAIGTNPFVYGYDDKSRGPGYDSHSIGSFGAADYGSVQSATTTKQGTAQSGAFGTFVSAGTGSSTFKDQFGTSKSLSANAGAAVGGAFLQITSGNANVVSVGAGTDVSLSGSVDKTNN